MGIDKSMFDLPFVMTDYANIAETSFYSMKDRKLNAHIYISSFDKSFGRVKSFKGDDPFLLAVFLNNNGSNQGQMYVFKCLPLDGWAHEVRAVEYVGTLEEYRAALRMIEEEKKNDDLAKKVAAILLPEIKKLILHSKEGEK